MIFSENRFTLFRIMRAASGFMPASGGFPEEPPNGGVWYNALQQKFDCNAQN
jgi:hypothetical protein